MRWRRLVRVGETESEDAQEVMVMVDEIGSD